MINKLNVLKFLQPIFIRPEGGLKQTYRAPSLKISSILRVKLALQIGLTILCTPIAIILRICGVLFLPINVSQIGNIIWLDCFLKEQKMLGKRHRILVVMAADELTANPYLLSLYRDHVYIAKKVSEYALAFPFAINPICSDSLTRFDAGGTSLEVHNALGKFAKNNTPLINLPSSDVDIAEKSLNLIGLLQGEKFVALHVRDPGYYADATHKSRNATLANYDLAIQFLIKRGLKVVRIGAPSAVAMDEMITKFNGGLIDYAKSEIRCEMIDIYLMAKCEFLLGTDSGPAFVSPLFHRNVAMTNAMPPSRALWFLDGDLSIFKKLTHADTGVPLKFSETTSQELYHFKNIKTLEARGFKVSENSPGEILDIVKEMLRTPPEHHFSQIAKNTISSGCRNFNALGHFSEQFLRKTFPEEFK